MDIVLIGSGNVASVLGRLAVNAGHKVLQVYSRQFSHAQKLANILHCKTAESVQSISRNADLTIIAISDQSINPFLNSFGSTNSIIVHTAGSMPIGELEGISNRYGILYPLQSLRKDSPNLPDTTILIDANNEETLNSIYKFAASISNHVEQASDEERVKYHLAAVLVNNFTNYLFLVTEDFCSKENISFAVLQPLIKETVDRLKNVHPFESQTGPARRNDLTTIQKHLELINEYPDIRELYNIFSRQIGQYYGNKKD